MSTTRVFHDWEFFEDGQTILPISVGLYTESGESSYYAVFADFDQFILQQDSWLYRNVWPNLSINGLDPINFDEEYVKSRSEIRMDIGKFLARRPDVELWGWYSGYDHVCLSQLWGRMVNLPAYVPQWTNDLQTEVRRRGLKKSDLPRQNSATRHNALADAKHEAVVMRFLEAYDLLDSPADRQRIISAAVEGRGPWG